MRARHILLVLVLCAMLAGCLETGDDRFAPDTDEPDGSDAGNGEIDNGIGDADGACVPLRFSPERIGIMRDEVVEFTLTFRNCGPATVMMGSGDACDATGGLEPRIEHWDIERTFRLGVPGHDAAIEPSLYACPAVYVQPRAVASGDTVEAAVMWNGTFVRNLCSQDQCPQHERAISGTYRIEVIMRDASGAPVGTAETTLELLPDGPGTSSEDGSS